MPNHPRGSQWRKWDLHVHTPSSIVHDYGGNDDEVWEKYITALEALPEEIKVLGINDYLFIDGYEKVLSYKQAGRLKNIELLLPVIELRLDKLVGSEKLRRINYHVIFADNDILTSEQIKAQFISGLASEAHLDSEHDDIDWSGLINHASLTDLGQKIWDCTPEEKRTNESKLHIGFNNINFPLKKVRELLASTYLKDSHLTAIGKVEWDDFRWDGSTADKKTLANSSDLVFTASPTASGANGHIKAFTDNKVNNKIIHSSDAHQFVVDPSNTKPKELGHCFTWIKADTTFEGLRQVLFDYDERVSIQPLSPYDDDTKYVLDEITFQDNGVLKNQAIPINRDLISIIGSKGSGKSLSLSAISSVSDLGNYVDQRHPIFEIEGNDQIVNLDLVDKNNSKREKHDIDLSVVDEEYHTEPILYIKQEELADRSKRPSKVRKEYLTELGIENLSIGYSDITDDTAYNLDQINSLIVDQEKIAHTVERDTSEGLGEYLVKKIKNLEATNKKLSNDKTRKVIEELSEIIAKGQEAKLWSKDDGFKDISLLAEDINERIETFNEQAKEFGISTTNLLPIVDEKTLSTSYKGASSALDKIIKDKRDEYAKKKKDLEELGVSEDIPTLLKTIENIQREIAKHKKALAELNKITEAIPTKQDYIGGLFAPNALITKRIQERVEEIDEKFGQFKDERKASAIFEKLFSNIDIKASIFFDFKQLELDIADCFYKGKITQQEVHNTIFGDRKPTYPNYFQWVNQSFWEFLEQHSLKGNLKDRIQGHSISGLERMRQVVLLDWYEYVSVSVEISHKFGTHIKEIGSMSTGELATVLLKLILVTQGLDKQIILLDQPEDHLDNEFIAGDLVDLIRILKKMRQIIMVTHNANLVVMTDSEQVIVANGLSEGYVSGGIENPVVRDSIIKILEGGTEAFKKRYKRYGSA